MIPIILLLLAARTAPNLDALRDGPAPAPAHRAVPLRPWQAYIRSGDYPAAARARRAQGRVAFELPARPDGRPAFCRVMRTSGSASLDAATCRILMARVRFTPARDAAGRAAFDDLFGTVEWRLPGR